MVKLKYISVHISRKIVKQGYWNYNTEGGAVFFFLEISEDCWNQRRLLKSANSEKKQLIAPSENAFLVESKQWTDPPNDVQDCFYTSHMCLERIYTLQLIECPWSKLVRYLRSKWLQRNANPQPLSSKKNSQPYGQTETWFEFRLAKWLSFHLRTK